MAAFDEARFPVEISYGATGGPSFNTTVVIVRSGQESRNQNWTESRIRWDVSTGVQTKADMDDLVTFFRNRRGRARGFRFKDWTDYKVENGDIGTGDGVEVEFQLKKIYNDGITQSSRDIVKPVQGTVSISFDGVPQASGFTVDSTTGIVTFDTAPSFGVAITASFEFDLPARFDTDELRINIAGYDARIADSIMVVELRGEDAINIP